MLLHHCDLPAFVRRHIYATLSELIRSVSKRSLAPSLRLEHVTAPGQHFAVYQH
jgi:hypothetical protein